ncbi:MAG: SPASM domain-containing protein [Acetobacteraceae bacterium]|nr:SPASM domain-containing protein [Acetobacteraceae bacterium]
MADDTLATHRSHPVPEIVDRLVRLWDYGRGRGVKVRGYWYNAVARLMAGRGRSFLDRVGDRNSCVATGNQINVEPTGDIFSCRMSGVRLGHIDDLEGMLHSSIYRHYVMRSFSPACEGCDIEGFCHGLCVGHLEGKYGDIYRTDDGYCEMFRGCTRKVLERL